MRTNLTENAARILIVDDDPDLQHILRELLESIGYDTDSSTGGSCALRKLEGDAPPPDLILLDYRLPDMDAIGFMAKVRKLARLARIPVILMTAMPKPLSLGEAIGAAACLKKPFNLDDLFRSIRESPAVMRGPLLAHEWE